MGDEADAVVTDEMLDAVVCPNIRKQARAIQVRLSQDHSFAALWQRLDQAERDRDRMLNALQLIRDRNQRDRFLTPHLVTIINRALKRVQAVRADNEPTP